VEPDRLINPLSKPVATFEVLWSKPAAYTPDLQIGIEAVHELPILRRIADKTRVKLDRMAQ
jgi:hypothetical protein